MIETLKHFAECSAGIVQLNPVHWSDLRDFELYVKRDRRPDERLVREGRLFAWGLCSRCGAAHPSQRRIFYAKKPSMHVCNAKCMGAAGHDCECSCGGKNHGAGFVSSGSLFGGAL